MNHEEKTHFLVQELIPIINELDEKPKRIVLDHISNCRVCMELYKSTLEFDEEMPSLNYDDRIELKPLKRLVQFNTGLKVLLIAIRAIILFYISYSGFVFSNMHGADIAFIQSAIYLFYTPAVIFLLIFTFTFFNKKWLWLSLLTDLFIIIFLSKIVQLFFS